MRRQFFPFLRRALTSLLFLMFSESASAALNNVSSITTGLYEPGRISIVIYDLMNVLMINDFWRDAVLFCDPSYNYTATGCSKNCTGPDDLSDALLRQDNPEELVVNAWGGPERLERLKSHFDSLLAMGVELYLIDEMWGCLTDEEPWRNYLQTVLNLSNTTAYFSFDHNIQIDYNHTSKIIHPLLVKRGYDASDSIYVDNDLEDFIRTVETNLDTEFMFIGQGISTIGTAVGYELGQVIVGDNQYNKPVGLVEKDMAYIEGRAAMNLSTWRGDDSNINRNRITSTVTRELLLPETDGRYEDTIEVAMYDYDTLLADINYAETIINEYCGGCNYTSCNCTGEDDLVNALESHPDPYSLVMKAFGGSESIRTLHRHFETIQEQDVDFYITTTAWYLIPVEAWQKFVFRSLEYMKLDKFFTPMEERIMVAEDRGQDLISGIGSLILEALLNRDDIEHPHDSIYVTHFWQELVEVVSGEFLMEAIHVQTHSGGVVLKDLMYIEHRAGVNTTYLNEVIDNANSTLGSAEEQLSTDDQLISDLYPEIGNQTDLEELYPQTNHFVGIDANDTGNNLTEFITQSPIDLYNDDLNTDTDVENENVDDKSFSSGVSSTFTVSISVSLPGLVLLFNTISFFVSK